MRILSFTLALLLSASFTFTACGNHQKPATPTAASASTTYACPMHPEITGKAGDKCTKCGMDLKAVAADVYACPMHPEITGKAGDKCSKCHMDLKRKE
jgi:predicted RNA-binding Zn-ribbon protein involved in translation (DUF1610 family)